MSAAAPRAKPVAILIAALGGQGGGVLAEWLVEAAMRAGFPAQSTSIPGVAQRTGATTYYVEIFPEPLASLARKPVLSLLPVPGAVDLFVASELLEAARIAGAGFPSATRTTVIASSSRTLTTAEKMAVGDGRFASDRLLQALDRQSKRLVAFDMDAAAREAGTVVSAVMFGTIAGSGLLPFGDAVCEAVIRDAGVGVAGSLRGFAAGAQRVRASAMPPAGAPAPANAERVPDASQRAAQAFPEPARGFIALGHARLVEYQDATYAALFLERLRAVEAAEANADPRAGHGHALLRETARWLALWMAFDDVVRVAQLKSARSRFERVRSETGADVSDVVRIVDYFKPGMPEIAGTLPLPLARRLLAWDEGRQRRGRRAFGFPLYLRSDGVLGFAALRVLASMRALRPRSARYAEEQRRVGIWLDAILAGASEDWRIGYEVALCGRLVKGYGETHARGQRTLAHLLEHVARATTFGSTGEKADAISAARAAALADEGGAALDQALTARGLPARPPQVKPLVFVPRASARKDAASADRRPTKA